MRQATVHYCVIISIIICVYHVIVKIRFQLSKLVHSCQKARNRVSEILKPKIFSREHAPHWVVRSFDTQCSPPQIFTSGYTPDLL